MAHEKPDQLARLTTDATPIEETSITPAADSNIVPPLLRLPDELLKHIFQLANNGGRSYTLFEFPKRSHVNGHRLSALHYPHDLQARRMALEANSLLVNRRLYYIAEEAIRGPTNRTLHVQITERMYFWLNSFCTELTIFGNFYHHPIVYKSVKNICIHAMVRGHDDKTDQRMVEQTAHAERASATIAKLMNWCPVLEEVQWSFQEDSFAQTRQAFSQAMSRAVANTPRLDAQSVKFTFLDHHHVFDDKKQGQEPNNSIE